MNYRGVFAQAYSVLWINMVNFAYGISVGWASPSIPLLRSGRSPLPNGPLTLLEASWVGAILCVGGSLATIFYSWFCERFGRKVSMLVTGIQFFISWLLIAFGDSFIYLLLARFLCGFGSGGMYVVIPLFVSEIADVNVRGIFGSMLSFFRNFGIVCGYILCSYLDYYTVPWIGIIPLLIFFAGYSFAKETPQYLVKASRIVEAEIAIKQYKDGSDERIKQILKELQVNHEHDQLNGLSLKELQKPATRRGIILGIILMNIVAFAGPSTLTTYCETVFREAGSTLSPEMSSITVASIQAIGVLFSTLLVEKAGRKFLIITATYLCAFCLIIMSLYLALRDNNIDVSELSWIPLVSLSMLMFVASIGPSSVPFVVLGEIFTQNIRSYMISLSLITNWIVSFVLFFLFPYMIEYLKLYGALSIFASISILLTTIVAILLPETKGLTIETIVELLGKRK